MSLSCNMVFLFTLGCHNEKEMKRNVERTTHQVEPTIEADVISKMF